MAPTQQTAQVYITNATDGNAKISLWHENSTNGQQTDIWDAAPGERVGPLTVHFETGWQVGFVHDYWAAELVVLDGPHRGMYQSSGVLRYSDWKECQLRKRDASQTLNFTVSTGEFNINLPSGGCSTPMNPAEVVTAQICVKNNASGTATITLYHNNSMPNGTQNASWSSIPKAGVTDYLTVPFQVGLSSALILDYWAVELVVEDGPNTGVYQSGSFLSNWTECQLWKVDAAKLTFAVDQARFYINTNSRPQGSSSMRLISPYARIGHVFVLMLENHSFDNIFAFSGIQGLAGHVATASDSNSDGQQSYPAASPAPTSMPTDPGHEFLDTLEQLAGPAAGYVSGKPYPPIVNTGFVANYATTTSEWVRSLITGKPYPYSPSYPSNRLPNSSEVGDVMKCFDTPNQLPVIHQLATEFAVCYQWFSSLPGPTWPNRFFVHGASSGGWDDSPTELQMGAWETPGGGFVYPSGASIFDRLDHADVGWRVYVDEDGPVAGGIPQAAALHGITWKVNTNKFSDFASDLQGPYPYPYTFIEPNYGDSSSGSYQGGSSQHPMDGVHGGEALIKATYEAIRNSPLWDRSLLILTYDEHGGLYDSGTPGVAPSPGDGSPVNSGPNTHGFTFDHYGVRVPAVVVSPLIPPDSVDGTVYDHTSVLATVEKLYGLTPLTQRDKQANDVLGLLSLPTPRTDCPTTLKGPAATESSRAALSEAAQIDVGEQPLPSEGNLIGFLAVVVKTDLELSDGSEAQTSAIIERFKGIRTTGEARDYIEEVSAKAEAAAAREERPTAKATPRHLP
jgi:phospholipase C